MDQMWILVEVRSGVPAGVQVFKDVRSAQSCEKELRKSLNLENDETGIFPINLKDVETLQ